MKRYRLLFCLPILYLLLTGCSILGYALGANSETEEVYYKTVKSNSSEFKSLELIEGDSLIIFTNNGDSLDGVFIQYQMFPPDEYTEELIYAFSDSVYFPKLNDTLWIIEKEKVLYYQFLGFDYKYLLVRNIKNDTLQISLQRPYVLLEEENQIIKEREYKELIRNKNEHVNAVPFNRYLQLMELHKKISLRQKENIVTIPKISLRQKENIVTIPNDSITKIVVPYSHRKDYALEGFLSGLAIDIFMTFLWIQSDPFTIELDGDWNWR